MIKAVKKFLLESLNMTKTLSLDLKTVVGGVVLALAVGASGGGAMYWLLTGKTATSAAATITLNPTETPKAVASSTPTPNTATGTVTSKQAQPELAAYVVADCPYGKQMQTVMTDAIAQAPEIQANFVLRYFFSTIAADGSSYVAMHGAEEGLENARQICLREEQPAVFWAYVQCYADGGTSANCATSAKVDQAKMEACVKAPERGVKFAQADNALAKKHSITGSPSLILNDSEKVKESNFGGRNAQGLKTIVCASADQKLSFCDQTLKTQGAAAAGNC